MDGLLHLLNLAGLTIQQLQQQVAQLEHQIQMLANKPPLEEAPSTDS